MNKLSDVGVDGPILRWFHSYCTARRQIVSINGFHSNARDITSGIAQGSQLGPFLFNVYINDVGRCFKFSNFLLYADDLKIYHEVANLLDVRRIQDDLSRFEEYCKDNKLTVNLNKCYHITFSRKRQLINCNFYLNNVVIERAKEVRDLGVIFDDKMIFDSHVDNICKKANKMLGFLMRTCKEFTSLTAIKNLYYTLVHSHLNFVTTVWKPQYDTYNHRIELIQNYEIQNLSGTYAGNLIMPITTT